MLSDNRTDSLTAERVVLLDEAGLPCGTALKSAVHTSDTPLHLAFSCWVVDDTGRTLLTRRAADKRTWPGVWTNTFCGHPSPCEDSDAAVRRRAQDELGAALVDVRLALPDFRYRAVMDNGIVENEVCPVYLASLEGEPNPDPREIDGLRWMAPRELSNALEREPDSYSPWMRWQYDQLLAGGLLVG